MTEFIDNPPVLWAMRLLAASFLAVLFLQSGLDKVLDRKGNLQWLTGHFAQSPLRHQVGLLLTAITVLEVAAGALSAAGALLLLFVGERRLALLGASLAATALLGLFSGQRLAKDYAGAAALVPYFLLALAGMGLLA